MDMRMNSTTVRNLGAASLIACLIANVGCQSTTKTSWLGAQNSAKPNPNAMASSMANQGAPSERQISAAQTPIAVASRNKQSQNQAGGNMPGIAPVAAGAPAVAATAVGANSGQFASMPTSPDVVPVQYTEPVSRGRTNVQRFGEYPREPMAKGAVTVDPAAPVHGSPYRNASHSRSVHQQGDDCPSCRAARAMGPYVPVYPQLSGDCNSGCNGCGQSGCGGECGGCTIETGPRLTDPQEYIYDGGDRDPQVRLRSDLTQVGLDPEDTVIQYETMDGKTQVQSGCRVAIYAPRFGSVRKKTVTRQNDLAMRPRATTLPDRVDTMREKLPQVNVSKQVKASNKENVRVVEAFRERSSTMPSEMILPMVTVSEAFKPYEDLALIRNGDMKGTDPALLAAATAAARSWTNVDQLHVIIDGQEAAVLSESNRPADVTLYEYKGARIRLCKVASEQIANPGDTISFTIRFDNVGEQPLSKLVITDSLAPRLEYVEDSQKSSLEAGFSTSPNTAGSVVLRWELEKPIKPGEGGLVRFTAKVR